MQENAKKKKKYIKKREENQQNNDQNYKNSSLVQQSKKPALARYPFDYNFEQLINLFLAKHLPDPTFIIKFSQKLIFGQQKVLDKKITEMDYTLQYDQGFILQLQEEIEKEDIQYDCLEEYRVKIFTFKFIDKCIGEYFIGTKYQRYYIQFREIFQRRDCRRVFVRMKKIFLQEFLQKFEEKARRMQNFQVSTKPVQRGNRKELRTQVQKISIPFEHINIQKLKEFIERSKKLDRKDIQIIQTKNSFGKILSFTIKLIIFQEQKQLKLEAFNYYFRHYNFILIPNKNTQHKKEIIEKYSKIQTDWIKITYIKGFKSSKWDQKTTIYKIRCGQISNKKSNYTNQEFQAFLLIGLFPKIEQYLQQLGQIINQVPFDEKIHQLFISFNNKIDDYLKSNEILQKFIHNYITDYLQKYKKILTIKSIKFPLNNIKLNLLISQQKLQEFNDQISQQIQQNMLKQIQIIKKVLDFQVDTQLLQKLQNKNFIIVQSKPKQIIYIQKKDNIIKSQVQFQEIIQQFQCYIQEYIHIKGKSKLNQYMQIILNIKKEQHFDQVLITEPFSNDKINYKVGFISSRKNKRFIQIVKEKIQAFQSCFDDYYEIIQKKAGEVLLEDQSDSIFKMSQKHKIKIVIDNTGIIDAHLYFQPLQRMQEIVFIKTNQLNRLPLGTTILFNYKAQLQKLSQKYLTSIKLKAKRSNEKVTEFIKQDCKQKNFTFIYKEQMGLNQMLSKGLGIVGDSCDICMFLPLKKKDIFVNQLIDSLKYNYSKMEYRVYVIELDDKVDMEKVINIPQYQVKSIRYQWFCQGKPYGKSGNDKINDASAKGLDHIVLSQEDLSLNLYGYGHFFDKNKKVIRCIKTLKEWPLNITNKDMSFTHKNKLIYLSKSQEDLIRSYLLMNNNIFAITLPFYQISFAENKEINIFTNESKSITKQETSFGNKHIKDVRIFYNEKSTQLIYSFEEKNIRMLMTCVEETNNYIIGLYKNTKMVIKNIKSMNILQETIKNRAKEYEVKVTIQKNTIQIGSYNKNDLERFKNIISAQMDYMIKLQKLEQNQGHIMKNEIIYPTYWDNHMKNDIQKFFVDRNTNQFKEIQGLFTVKPIQSLFRLQNKILYRKYTEQLRHLQFLNKGKKPLELKLFHGTNQTPPGIIWQEKQDGFNINYTSEKNLLGKAIYFAEKSEYSLTYRHKYQNPLGQTISCMFLCLVIVGDSQTMIMNHHNNHIIDTNYKNSDLRFESGVGLHQICKIYTVYKNRRAYPLYLIEFK